MAYLANLQSSALTNQNISSALLLATYTNTTRLRKIFIDVFADQIAGNGNYVVYATRQRSGAGSAYEVGNRTTVAVPAAVTAQAFPTLALMCGATDVIKVYLIGLAGDTATPNTIVDISEEFINVDSSGNPTSNDTSGITTLLARIVGTLASGTHNAQSGDAYAVVSNGTYGLSALKTLIDALPTAAAITTAVWAAGTRTLTSISALAASIASAVLDAVAASYNTANTIGAKINAAGAASDPLENDVPGSYVSGTAGYVLGHLSDDGVTVISVLDGDDLTIRRGDTTTVNYTELGNISTRSALYFTLKQNLQGADSDARIQVTEAGGLVVLNGSASGLTSSDASLTVTNATTGAVTLVLKPNLTKQLAAMDGLRWDVQMVASGAVTTLTEGDAEVIADVTRAVS